MIFGVASNNNDLLDFPIVRVTHIHIVEVEQLDEKGEVMYFEVEIVIESAVSLFSGWLRLWLIFNKETKEISFGEAPDGDCAAIIRHSLLTDTSNCEYLNAIVSTYLHAKLNQISPRFYYSKLYPISNPSS